ncbi:hypothetical protein FA13DRAFT_153756 [Coprinellus micaceus]|uniref:Uncharacterized protein n=1 Tax=Coprinellus micaceus TaxID=71717 RepID=A0A4Y7TGY1_COPMI|nr:hypothetical protein FA13DRAFT_153756 [Coprinellus micaceus]
MEGARATSIFLLPGSHQPTSLCVASQWTTASRRRTSRPLFCAPTHARQRALRPCRLGSAERTARRRLSDRTSIHRLREPSTYPWKREAKSLRAWARTGGL